MVVSLGLLVLFLMVWLVIALACKLSGTSPTAEEARIMMGMEHAFTFMLGNFIGLPIGGYYTGQRSSP